MIPFETKNPATWPKTKEAPSGKPWIAYVRIPFGLVVPWPAEFQVEDGSPFWSFRKFEDAGVGVVKGFIDPEQRDATQIRDDLISERDYVIYGLAKQATAYVNPLRPDQNLVDYTTMVTFNALDKLAAAVPERPALGKPNDGEHRVVITLTFTSKQALDEEDIDQVASAAEKGVQIAVQEGYLTRSGSEAEVELHTVEASTG